jgi:DMSO/TMAO reductase YedYZ molybdopterin-dependent catalytic subunit
MNEKEPRRNNSFAARYLAGAASGLVAALAMMLAMMSLRLLSGVATAPELVGDRIAPLLPVDTFLYLLDLAGGYNELKQIGVVSVIAGQLAVGLLGGLWYATRTERARLPEGTGRYSVNRRGLLFAGLFVGTLWLASIALLWPVLGTHYAGRPPGQATFITALGLLFSYAVFGATLILTYGATAHRAPLDSAAPALQSNGRRALLAAGAGVAVAIALGAVMRRLYGLATFSYDGTQYKGADVQAITPNERFYVVSKNVIDPRVERPLWRLEVTGMVESPQSFSYEVLTAMTATTQETTLRCISNQTGGGLMSNAAWKGVPLGSLIEAARPKGNVLEVILHAADNYTDTIAFEKAMNPTTLVAFEMNGQPLPFNHGYPVRVIVPGLYGEKNVKWVTRIELVERDAKGFYEQQGWGPNFVVPTSSRFDQPDDRQKFKLAAMATAVVTLRGVAHGGDRGIARVEISPDDGRTWQEANVEHARSPSAWSLWSYDWRPNAPGEYKLAVRATDGAGALQTPDERGIVPEGSTGYHKITVNIEA